MTRIECSSCAGHGYFLLNCCFLLQFEKVLKNNISALPVPFMVVICRLVFVIEIMLRRLCSLFVGISHHCM